MRQQEASTPGPRLHRFHLLFVRFSSTFNLSTAHSCDCRLLVERRGHSLATLRRAVHEEPGDRDNNIIRRARVTLRQLAQQLAQQLRQAPGLSRTPRLGLATMR